MSKDYLENKFKVNVQYIKDFSFENPNAPKIFNKTNRNPEINFDVNVLSSPLGKDLFEVSLSISVKAQSEQEVLFQLELIYCGVFSALDSKDNEHKQKILLIEAPKLLFPFVRAIISDTTRDGGFMPLILQPIDFEKLYKDKMSKN